MANFGRRNLGPRRGNSRDLSPQGPFSGDLSRSKKNPDRGGRDLYGVSRRVGAAVRPFRPRAPPLQSMAAGGSPQPAAPIGADEKEKQNTDGWLRHGRMVGRAGQRAVPDSRRRRKAGSAERQAADDRQTAPDGGPQQDDGPCRAAGYNRKLAATGRRAVPDSRSWAEGWPRRMAGRADGWPRTGYRKSINS